MTLENITIHPFNGPISANKSCPCHSQGLFSRITFREPVFLGGTGNITASKVLPVFDGFVGCIRKFIANEHEYNFKGAPYGDVAQGFDVRKYSEMIWSVKWTFFSFKLFFLINNYISCFMWNITYKPTLLLLPVECVTDLCSRYPCKHAGKCLLSDQGAICLCPLGFGGDLCEMRLDLQVSNWTEEWPRESLNLIPHFHPGSIL